MDHLYRHDRLEAHPVIPAAADIPLTTSVIAGIGAKFVDNDANANAAEALSLEELLSYLRNIEDFSLPLVDAIKAQTEAIGDPAAPAGEQLALLAWLDQSWLQWEQTYALEQPLLLELRQLRPLAGALVLTDSKFPIPGQHPLHRLMDAVQDSAVGWQESLGRAGEPLAVAVRDAVAGARCWFSDPTTDLEQISNAITTLAERDQSRALRMSQRAVETESGREKSSAARSGAAHMINNCLQGQALPESIGRFVKSDWYDSAQLVLLKFGADSEEWQLMQETTKTLLESVQAYDPEDGERRKQLFELATQLPKNMRRWLLSLQHDGDAIDESLGVVEFVHLRLLRQQELERQTIEPIPVAAEDSTTDDEAVLAAVNALSVGQWLSIDTGESTVRVQLALNNTVARQLMFTNRSGVKALVLGYTEFAERAAQQQVSGLISGAGFSRCLANTAGIDSEAAVQALHEEASQQEDITQAREREAAARQQLAEAAAREQQAQKEEQERQLAEQAAAEEQERQRLAQEQASRDQASAELLGRQREEADRLAREQQVEKEAVESPDDATPERPTLDLSIRDTPAQEESNLDLDLTEEPDMLVDEDLDLGELARQAAEPATAMVLGDETMQAKILQERHLKERVSTVATDLVPPPEPSPNAEASARDITTSSGEIQLPMGAWLGFHDGDTPIMARLAVHDREQGDFIFVNREGIKLRQLSSEALASLIDRGQVDILETRSNFRDAVRLARNERDEKGEES
ncbi:MAG: DUF1631 family protein [Halieaceae bacterium]